MSDSTSHVTDIIYIDPNCTFHLVLTILQTSFPLLFLLLIQTTKWLMSWNTKHLTVNEVAYLIIIIHNITGPLPTSAKWIQ